MSRVSLLLFIAGLVSCSASQDDKLEDSADSGASVETGESASPSTDLDEDGFTSDEDCDDSNPDIHPDAIEICNDVDDNCDGLVDDDDSALDMDTQTAWYHDYDGDGYGDESDVLYACAAPSSYVAESVSGFDCDDTDPRYQPGAAEADCTDPNDYNCDGSVGYADEDGDGFAACEDCDDTLFAINDDAVEICDGLDNDCNGWVDDSDADLVGAATWYGDADGDTYGGQQFTATACDAPQGYVDNSDDCDDLNAKTYPGATETCDEADNNCDGDIDEGVETTWYADTDNDGYGDSTTTTDACSVPPGYVWDATDCDDTSATTNPASYEVCDGTDNNCDGLTDEDSALDVSTWYADSDADGYGDPATTDFDCNQPTGYVSDDTDCDDTAIGTYPGADEYCDGVDTDCDGTLDESGALDATTWYADADGDGYGNASSTEIACDQSSGYTADDTDCDDTAVASYPGAAEYCDNVDTDCDGTVDEDDALDATTWYADADSDAYGDSATTDTACSQPSGFVADDTDCDDTDGTTYPGAAETCDDVDADCDGSFVDTGADDCHALATCTPDNTGLNHTCECASGYTGDGTSTCDADYFPNSTLLSSADKTQLNTWVSSSSQVWTLCYQKSTDGNSSSTFHSKCDSYSNTISVAELDSGVLMGGYAGTSWSGSSGWQNDASNFLFSLTRGYRIMAGTGTSGTTTHAQYSNSSHGTTFGGGHDWYVNSSMTGGYCNLGYTYACQSGSPGSTTCRNDFCGNYSSWTITELEVWGR
jgi:hypothetical protein